MDPARIHSLHGERKRYSAKRDRKEEWEYTADAVVAELPEHQHFPGLVRKACSFETSTRRPHTIPSDCLHTCSESELPEPFSKLAASANQSEAAKAQATGSPMTPG